MDEKEVNIASLKSEIQANAIGLMKLMELLYAETGDDHFSYQSRNTRESVLIVYSK